MTRALEVLTLWVTLLACGQDDNPLPDTPSRHILENAA